MTRSKVVLVPSDLLESDVVIDSRHVIPIVFVTAILPDGKPSGSISEAPFGG